MTRIESDLLLALLLLYLYECVYWVRADEQVFTRSSERWESHDRNPLSFTLLNSAPLLVDPFLLRPGFVRRKNISRDASIDVGVILGRVATRLNELWLLEMQCRVHAMILLVFLPCIVWTHRLTALWQPLVIVLIASHSLLMMSYGVALRRHAPKRLISVFAPVLLNPLGATRLLDALSQLLFDEEIKRRSLGDPKPSMEK